MERRLRAGRGLIAVAAIALVGPLVAVPAAAEGETAAPTETVEWGACPEDVAAEAPDLECGLVPVPLDYADPESAEIEIMVSRLAAQDPDRRRGVLLFNPGGPGGSGLAMPADLVSRGLPAEVSDSYDLIGMDTRGVGYSGAMHCGLTSDYQGNIPPYAVDEEAVAEHAVTAEAAADLCAENDPDGELRHLTTENTARDLDRIRIALGEEQISYYGASYGTALGAAYASLFPERSDRIVLDSNIGDTHLDQDGIRRYGLGAEETFPDFFAWAAERHDEYGLGETTEEVRATYFELAERLDENPVVLPEGRMDGAVFRLGTFVTLYHELQYPDTALAWQGLLASDETAELPMPDASAPVGVGVGVGVPGAEGVEGVPGVEGAQGAGQTPAEPSPFDNSWTVFLSVTCNDVEWPEDVESYQRAVEEDRERYPLFGAASANILPCAFWPHEPAEPVEVLDEGPGNVLVVQNQRDPVTPHLGGELLNDKFGERSRLVSVDASGHGVYVNGDNVCAHDVTTEFLVGGDLPEEDVVCAAE